MTTIPLDGTWLVRPDDIVCIGTDGLATLHQATEGWLPAQVPGKIQRGPIGPAAPRVVRNPMTS